MVVGEGGEREELGRFRVVWVGLFFGREGKGEEGEEREERWVWVV